MNKLRLPTPTITYFMSCIKPDISVVLRFISKLKQKLEGIKIEQISITMQLIEITKHLLDVMLQYYTYFSSKEDRIFLQYKC